ncbi:MAG: hypothetical protein NTU51_01415 [Bacteroidetes bacterium]|nr:hypothetical protein [Bacteroidota bacterium]
MDKNIITRELQILLEAINEQFEIIREYNDFIPQIEFDMIMENVRKLYETFHRLQRLNDPLLFVEKKISGPRDLKAYVPPLPAPSPEHLAVLPPVASAEPLPEPPAVIPPAAYPEPLPEPPAAATPLPVKETMPQNESNPVRPTEPATHSPIPMRPLLKKETSEKRKAKTAELELFASEEPVFNIKLKEAREKSLGPKISRPESLKSSIGINDKFMFINELFDGNLREYNESVETLSGFKTLPQAQEYLDLLRRRNNWNSSSNAFRRIKELVEKRY